MENTVRRFTSALRRTSDIKKQIDAEVCKDLRDVNTVEKKKKGRNTINRGGIV